MMLILLGSSRANAREPVGVVRRVVDAGEQRVLERDAAARRAAVVARGVEQLADRPALVHRHQLGRAARRSWRAARRRAPAAGPRSASSRICGTRPLVRHGDAPRAEVQAVLVVQDADRAQSRRRRLASGSPMPMKTMLKRSSCQPWNSPIDHAPARRSRRAVRLRFEAHEPGGAERAPERAADLAREAERERALGAHRHALDTRAVREPQHELVCVSPRGVPERLRRQRQREVERFGESLAQSRG